MIAITVADCAPILLYDREKKVVAAVHAGWQGTATRLAAKTVAAMQSMFDCDPADLQAAIGPCIGKCCYEVDAPVRLAFTQNGVPWDSCTGQSGAERWHLDLTAANRGLLISAGVPEAGIQCSDMCVSCHRELFFSYRRDSGETGRQMGFIMLKA
jgi:YfiH family protein